VNSGLSEGSYYVAYDKNIIRCYWS